MHVVHNVQRLNIEFKNLQVEVQRQKSFFVALSKCSLLHVKAQGVMKGPPVMQSCNLAVNRLTFALSLQNISVYVVRVSIMATSCVRPLVVIY